MVGTGIMDPIIIPYPIEVRDSPYSYPTQSMREFSVKMRTDSDNTHGGGFICHLLLQFQPHMCEVLQIFY